MPGPRKTPTHLRLLRGNPGHQPIRPEPEPDRLAEIPEPPAFVIGHAADEWWRIAEELYRLNLLTAVDINPLAAYCMAYARWRAAEEALARIAATDPIMSGLMVKARNGTPMQNPLALTASKAASDMVKYAAEFGLTPAARSRIAAGIYSEGKTAGKFDGLLAG
jgi:P27 family predicted phage terminase small subunit